MNIADLRDVFSGRLLTAADDVAPFLVDWRKTWRGIAIGVAQPDTVADVAAVVRWCAANNVSIVPQGGNTGQSGGSVPQSTGTNLVLSLVRLNRIRDIDPINNTITVDAGCVLQHVQDAAETVERLFPLSLGAEGSCTIGGNLASNAGGTAVLRYGNARDLCLGLEVVTDEGEIWNGMRGLRKDNSGYDLRDLFIGSEGTLGIITGAVLKLFPKPAATVVAWVSVLDCNHALRLFMALRARLDTALTGFELVSETCLKLVLKHFPQMQNPLPDAASWFVLVELSDAASAEHGRASIEDVLAGAMAEGLLEDAVIADSLTQAKALWQLRERISEAQAAEGRAIKHDLAVPISNIAQFITDALTVVAKQYPDLRPVVFGHLGDGNLHFNFSSAEGADQATFMALQPSVNAIVHDLVRAHQGTISAEHGLGVLRRDEAHAYRSPVERKMMAAIKQAFDPRGLMNPGKLLG